MSQFTPPDNLDELLILNRSIRLRLPNTWNPFFARFGKLRPIQMAAIPEILKGSNVLITAPTAGGKTEAVAAPLCERLKADRWTGMSIMLVTPTRALVNDLFHRLEGPCQNLGIALARKTGDHPLSAHSTEQFVITTPESLESMLTHHRERLDQLRAIVIDEVHLLDGTPRGDQLRFLLSRLEIYLRFKLQRPDYALQKIAISATVPNPSRTAAAYLGENASVVTVAGQRAIESKILLIPGDDAARAQAAMLATQAFADVRKILVFVNSRNQADLAGLYQHEPFKHTPVYGHHGSLSKDSREATETRFKSDRRAICLATMTLEVGIDIGDVDLVVCMDPPFSLGSFLQRIGRGCRRLEGKTRVLCAARDKASEYIFEALVAQSSIGVPETPAAPIRRSVVVQQTLAYLRQVEKHARTIEQCQKTLALTVQPHFTAEKVAKVLEAMAGENLLRLENNVAEPGVEGWNFIESRRIFNNIGSSFADVALVDADTGRQLANVRGLKPGVKGVQIGGHSYELVGSQSGRIRKIRVTSENQPAPTYAARKLPYSADVGVALARRFEIEPNELLMLNLGDTLAAFTWLGQLQNLALEGLLARRKITAEASSFCLHFRSPHPADCLRVLQELASEHSLENPLLDLPVEKVIDMGPYFKLLDKEQQRQSRGDWFQLDALRSFITGLEKYRVVQHDTPLGVAFISLAGI
jgi:ATP-dependent Lhr-like helicase